MTSYKEYKLGEITKIINGATPSTKKTEYFDKGSIPWITPKDLSGNSPKYISYGERNITELGLENSSVKTVPKGTVLFTSRAPIGYVAIAKNELTTNQGFKSFICNEKIIKNEYLYYFLISKRHLINSMANGSTFKELSLSSAKDISIKLPNLKVQTKISDVLNNLDRKIELNYQTIDILEKLAENTYNHWFIDKLKEDQKGSLENWESKNIGDVVEIMGGGTPKTSKVEYWENGDINWFTPSDLTSTKNLYVNESVRKITQEGLKNSNARLIPPYSLLLSSRATIGVLAINQLEVSTNQGFIVLIPNQLISIYQLYFWAKLNKNKIISMANGSTFKEISKRDLKKIKILVPKNITKFNHTMEIYFNQIEELINESKILIEIRDGLIPLLIK